MISTGHRHPTEQCAAVAFPALSAPRGHCGHNSARCISRRGAAKTPGSRSCTHHGQQRSLLEAGVEGDELRLRALLPPQESAGRERRAAVSRVAQR